MTPGDKITKWFQDEGHPYYDELAEKIDGDLLTIRTQYAELERKAIEQSEYIQSHGLTEYEMGRLTAERDQLRAELATEKEWRQNTTVPFLEWAQSYLYSGRWAGHDMFDAIKTELLERDAERDQAQADARELAQALEMARPYVAVSVSDEEANGFHASALVTKFRLALIIEVLSKHGAKYLENK